MKRKIDKYAYSVLDDAADILKSIGMPERLYNPRCVMALAACAEITEKSKWRHASEAYHGTHDIISFINRNFPNKANLDTKGYQENSRETFRDETLKPWISAGILEARYGLASNLKDNAYRLTAQFVALIRTYGTERWLEELEVYKSIHPSYETLLKQVKDLDPGYSVNYNGLVFTLDRSPHNKLQKAILDVFAKYFASGAELLYIGDTSDRMLRKNDNRLSELGINVFSKSTCIPDIILYDEKHNRILFIEAYNSVGEFTYDRVKDILACCHCKPGTEVAFITAFATMKKALQVINNIAWDTDIWVAEYETHLIHKNGDKFIGRKLK